MIIVNFLIRKNNERCSKTFYDFKKADRFINKVLRSHKLVLLSIEREIC